MIRPMSHEPQDDDPYDGYTEAEWEARERRREQAELDAWEEWDARYMGSVQRRFDAARAARDLRGDLL